ncbi:MAG: phosphatidylserine decarboxylase family protein [Deltaproteobacteria bacterium]|jgi:phosphatidylserine decarboxylase|nr:phosphatidylserine decarboxylase family protein [Deltaproteobacteria bacterium]MDA8299791.1 phosphatidylserine decarboxylase family protein [Deltaproteobacteria bacterium]
MKYIAKEGVQFIIGSFVFSIFFLVLYFYFKFIAIKYIFFSLFILSLIFFFFCVYFFRDPERKPDSVLKEDEIVSPADGKIIFLQRVFDERFLKGEVFKISIFMSLFNVHVNRIPFGGIVEKVIYNKGRFFSANLDKASSENEFNAVILNAGGVLKEKNKKIAFVQIAGLIARRIVCKIKQGDAVKSGERFGLIKFGSRLDIYLPAGFTPYVEIGGTVFSGKTILGKINDSV